MVAFFLRHSFKVVQPQPRAVTSWSSNKSTSQLRNLFFCSLTKRDQHQHTATLPMDDVDMETPPASLVEFAESSLAPQQHASKGDIIRSNLGKSTVKDFGYFRDILEEHVRERTQEYFTKETVRGEIVFKKNCADDNCYPSLTISMTGESVSSKCPGELQCIFFS